MADEKNEKKLEAVERTKPRQEYNMKGPGGSEIRKQEAHKAVARDQARYNGDRAAKYAKIEKEKIANKEHVRHGTRGRLTKQYSKNTQKALER